MPFIIQITCLGQIIGYLWVTGNPLDLNGNTRNIQRRTYELCNISFCDIILFSGNINQLYKITVYVESRSKILWSLFMNCVLESNFSLLTSIGKHTFGASIACFSVKSLCVTMITSLAIMLKFSRWVGKLISSYWYQYVLFDLVLFSDGALLLLV